MTQSMKYILVTGGTLSGVGKGVTASSLGVLLQSKGYPVTFIKIDPYINLDAGTLNPFDHGEMYVLEDGTEVDLDLGNYERFLDISLTGAHCITTGKIFDEIIKKEREGSFLGKTVQMIPHVTNLIKKKIKEASSMPIKMGVSFEKNNKTKPEICIIELGGTIGDIESLVFSESLRQIKREAGKNDFLIVTVEFLPQISNGELKTKPIQNSIRKSLSFGIKPDIIVCRSEINIDSSIKEKISNFCEVEIEDIFQSKTLNSVYDLPELLNSQGVFESVKKHLNLKNIVYEEELTNQILSCVNDTLNDTSEENKIKKNEIKNKKTNKKRNNKKIKKEINEEINEKIEKTPLINEPIPNNSNSLTESFLFFSCRERFVKLSKKYDTKIKVSIIGKYVGNNDCYLSLHNAIKFSAAHLQVDVVINWIEATDLEEKDVNELLSGSDCIIVPGGFGPRGVEGKIKAISYARTNNIPFLGICLGFQMAVVEFARNVLGIQKAHSEEFEKRDDNVVVYLNDYEQKSFGGTMRLGNKPTFLKDGRIKEWYKVKEKAYERHRHRYEVNTAMVDLFEEKGLEFVGKNEGNERMEVFDYKNNDFFIGVQFHPEFNARPNAPHCLFNQLLSYGLKKKNNN